MTGYKRKTRSQVSVGRLDVQVKKKSGTIKFDGLDEAAATENEETESLVPKISKLEEVDEDDEDESPEIIQSTDNDILALRKLHQEVQSTNQRKRKVVKKQVEIEKSVEVDDSLISFMNQISQNTQVEIKTNISKIPQAKSSTFVKSTSRKIGNLEIMTIDEADSLNSYPLPSSAAELTKQLQDGRPRIRYQIYKSQKKRRPASRFVRSNIG